MTQDVMSIQDIRNHLETLEMFSTFPGGNRTVHALRSALQLYDDSQAALTEAGRSLEEMDTTNTDLALENARLREALEQIAGIPIASVGVNGLLVITPFPQEIARTALEGDAE